ncbi:MAG TPA: radical SAM protein [Anaerolineales bacterium]|nr:radical SAM protein [Anaerolineales bacterium]
MHIHLLQALSPHRLRSSKDTNGGYGTVNDFGDGLAARILKAVKRQTMNFPELLPAYVHAIVETRGHTFTYGVNRLDPRADLVLLQTSITNFQSELAWADRARKELPGVRVGFIGGMSSGNPAAYAGAGDFVVVGEAERALLEPGLAELSGVVNAGLVEDLDDLPFPDWSHLEDRDRSYGYLRARGGRLAPMLASRGCPMSCAFYCTYPLVQGRKFRVRSTENLIGEIEYLQRDFGVDTILFRDPIFSLRMDRIEDLCRAILARGLKFTWICETHPKFLTDDLILLMRRAGCRTIKLGIESGDLEIMKQSRRALPELEQQEHVVRMCEEHGIDVLAFYILGFQDDDPQSVSRTIDYAIHLNTFGAQFTIATPYPGTPWYDALRSADQPIRFDENLEHYNQYRLVYNHPRLTADELHGLKSDAYRRYYFRPGYVFKLIRRHLKK